MSRRYLPVQTVVLGIVGAVVVVLGGNIALGGFETLGLQFPPAGLDVADALSFHRHDNNVRFLGGFFAGAGLLIAFAAICPRLRPAAAALLLLLPLGGLARLFHPGYPVLADPAFYSSLFAEFVAAPLFAFWILRTGSGVSGA